jgi:hypothetical protein
MTALFVKLTCYSSDLFKQYGEYPEILLYLCKQLTNFTKVLIK